MTFDQVAPALLAELRVRRPVVVLLAASGMADDGVAVVRALGASAIPVLAPEELEDVVTRADVLVVSLATPTAERLELIHRGVAMASRRGIPVVIDPDGAGGVQWRTEFARRVIKAATWPLVRAHPAEAAALVGKPSRLRGGGADVPLTPDDVLTVGTELVKSRGVVALTGARDLVLDARRGLAVDNGHPWMAAMSGAGAMATAIVGVFAGVADRADFISAAAAGLACLGIAAEMAAKKAGGPGTLKPHLIDALFMLSPEAMKGLKWAELPGKARAPRRSRRSRR